MRVFVPDSTVLASRRLIIGDHEHELLRARWTDPVTAVVQVGGVSDRAAAEACTGLAIAVRRGWFGPVWPVATLVGAAAVRDEDGAPLGEVRRIEYNGAQPLLAIGEAYLVPFVEALIARADPAEVRVRVIPGLLD